MVVTFRTEVTTRGQGDAADVTGEVTRAVGDSGLARGTVTVFVVGSTAGVTTMEYEPGVVADLDRALERIAPRYADYGHHRRWGDDNGSSHVRAAIVGPSVTVPFVDGSLVLGTWQQIVVVELDTRPRTRGLVVQVTGE
jgi:secondary thiamine-phosphate synthase enzyme